MTDAELADAIDPRLGATRGGGRWTTEHAIVADADLIAASDALRASAERERVAVAECIKAIEEQADNRSSLVRAIKDREVKQLAMAELSGLRQAAIILRELGLGREG